MSAPRGRAGGPRQAPGPRRGSGRRGAGAARRPGHASAGPYPAPEVAPPVDVQAPPEAVAAVPAQPPVAQPAAPRELSGLRLLLDQLDALLRDPTLTRALRAFAARIGDGVRELLAAIGRLRLPRRLLLGLLLLTLPLALLALLSSDDDERQRAPGAGAPVARSPATGGLGGVGMPNLASAPDEVAPVSVALVLDRTYGTAARRRELRALGTWLAEHHAPGTRVSLIDARTGRASAPLRPADLARAQATRPRSSTAAAVDAAFASRRGRRLLVTLGSSAPPTGARTLSIATRRGARAAIPTRSGRRSRATIDDRRPEALAATVARAIMAISGQSERR